MEAESAQTFNERLSQWVSSQGFWFQLRHSLAGGGGWSVTMYHLVRLGVKVLLVLILLSFGLAYYLVKRPQTEGFLKPLDAKLAAALQAKEAKVDDFRREQSTAMVRRISVEGGGGTFFRTLDARNLEFPMGLLDGLTRPWKAGTVKASWADIELMPGAGSEDEAAMMRASIFRDWPNFQFQLVEVENANVRWGFSQRTMGSIKQSRMNATRVGENWTLQFDGGTFSQNWLKGVVIDDLVVECQKGLLSVPRARFSAGGGKISVQGLKLRGGAQPQVQGTVVLNRVPLRYLVPASLLDFVDGSVSGEFVLSGSTNSTTGVEWNGLVTLSDDHYLTVRESFPLLNALGVIDGLNSYKRLDLKQGAFRVRTSGGQLEVTDLNVKTLAGIGLGGEFRAKLPVGQGVNPEFSLLKKGERGGVSIEQPTDGNDLKISMEEAGRRSGKAVGFAQETNPEVGLIQRRDHELGLLERREDEAVRLLQAVEYEGDLKLDLPGNVFRRADVLRARYAPDAATGRVILEVPLKGPLHELTKKQADDLLLEARVRLPTEQ